MGSESLGGPPVQAQPLNAGQTQGSDQQSQMALLMHQVQGLSQAVCQIHSYFACQGAGAGGYGPGPEQVGNCVSQAAAQGQSEALYVQQGEAFLQQQQQQARFDFCGPPRMGNREHN